MILTGQNLMICSWLPSVTIMMEFFSPNCKCRRRRRRHLPSTIHHLSFWLDSTIGTDLQQRHRHL